MANRRKEINGLKESELLKYRSTKYQQERELREIEGEEKRSGRNKRKDIVSRLEQ